MTSRPYLAVVQYDGARFAGWQRQPDARTVQAELETVLQRLEGGEQRVVTTGAGRTDAGVHALGQGVSFTPGPRWDGQANELRRALNALLPDDLWVEQVHAMRPGFDARRSATARRYRYVIGTDEAAASPFRRPYEWALGGNRPLDITVLRDASALLVGEHDFRGLAAAGAATAHYRCRVALAEWAPRADVAGGGADVHDRGRSIPASHGALPRGRHGGHRPRPAPAGGFPPFARCDRQSGGQSARPAAGFVPGGGAVSPGTLR